MRWYPQDDKTSAQTAATAGAAKAGGPWEFVLARYRKDWDTQFPSLCYVPVLPTNSVDSETTQTYMVASDSDVLSLDLPPIDTMFNLSPSPATKAMICDETTAVPFLTLDPVVPPDPIDT